MAISVLIPTPLRTLTSGQDTVQVEAANVKELVSALEAAYPGMGNRLSDDAGTLRRFINFYVNGEDIRFLQSAETPLKDGDELSIVPAVAGGKGI
jgi:sulfur-carrier protein